MKKMKETSKDYAVALFNLARETESEEAVLSGLMLVKEVFSETPGMIAFLRSPAISKEAKLGALKGAFEGEVHDYVFSFLALMTERGDADILEEAIESYEALFHAENKLATARIVSAAELTAEEKETLCAALSKKSGKEVLTEYEIDPTLIGGLVVEMDGVVLDGSLSRRLKTLKDVMDE